MEYYFFILVLIEHTVIFFTVGTNCLQKCWRWKKNYGCLSPNFHLFFFYCI